MQHDLFGPIINIGEWRNKLGWSKARAARELGLNDASYRKYESGIKDPKKYIYLAMFELSRRFNSFDAPSLNASRHPCADNAEAVVDATGVTCGPPAEPADVD